MTTVARPAVRRPLFAIVAAALALVVARAVWPGLHFDGTSLVLFAIAAAAWALAYLPISKFKAGDYEIELVQTVGELRRKVSQIETADRIAGELEQKVIASEATAALRPARTGGQWDNRVMRGDPADRGAEAEASPAVDEYQRIVASSAPDEDKIARAVDLVERFTRPGNPAAIRAAEFLRRILGEVQAGRLDVSPRLTNVVLDFAWRLILVQAGSR